MKRWLTEEKKESLAWLEKESLLYFTHLADLAPRTRASSYQYHTTLHQFRSASTMSM